MSHEPLYQEAHYMAFMRSATAVPGAALPTGSAVHRLLESCGLVHTTCNEVFPRFWKILQPRTRL